MGMQAASEVLLDAITLRMHLRGHGRSNVYDGKAALNGQVLTLRPYAQKQTAENDGDLTEKETLSSMVCQRHLGKEAWPASLSHDTALQKGPCELPASSTRKNKGIFQATSLIFTMTQIYKKGPCELPASPSHNYTAPQRSYAPSKERRGQ